MPRVPSIDEINQVADPHDRLVRAGARLLVDDGFRILAAGISPDTVTRMAGRTRRVFYDHFETKEDFAREVLLPFLDLDEHEILDGTFTAAFEELVIDAEGDLVDSVHALSAAFFEASNASADPHLQTIAWSLGQQDPAIRVALSTYFAAVDQLYGNIIEKALVAWGRKMREPWTPQLLTCAMRGLADGFYARNRVQPGAISHEFFATCILSVAGSILQPKDEPDESMDLSLRGISRSSAAAWHETQNPRTLTNTRQRVLAALVPTLRETGFAAVSLADIAEASNVSLAAVARAFGSVDAVVEAAVLETLPALEREAAFDLATQTLALSDVLARHFTRLTGWAETNPELAQATVGTTMMSARRATQNDEARETLELVAMLARPVIDILEQVAAMGQLRADADIVRTAQMATQIALSQAMTGGGSAEATVSWLVPLILHGVQVPEPSP